MIHQETCSSQNQQKEPVQSDPWFLPGFGSGKADNNRNHGNITAKQGLEYHKATRIMTGTYIKLNFFICTSWWLSMLLLWPFIITGFNKSYTKVRQSAVGVATSIIYERYLSTSCINTTILFKYQSRQKLEFKSNVAPYGSQKFKIRSSFLSFPFLGPTSTWAPQGIT